MDDNEENLLAACARGTRDQNEFLQQQREAEGHQEQQHADHTAGVKEPEAAAVPEASAEVMNEL